MQPYMENYFLTMIINEHDVINEQNGKKVSKINEHTGKLNEHSGIKVQT